MVAPSQPTYFICAAAGGAPTLFFIHYYLLFCFLSAIFTTSTRAAYRMPPMAQMNQLYWGWPLPLGPKVYSKATRELRTAISVVYWLVGKVG